MRPRKMTYFWIFLLDFTKDYESYKNRKTASEFQIHIHVKNENEPHLN